ncbi:Hypothetical predicted protein [Mytilus galloprovincialis]|uniref:Uncharacterized protein n=1 Tax=Mytilus galloprovincialis TaxID=29158 RepID=A0A8B6FNU7_MYTGA|nr:Hypothetical predicted protein [Mytilus galloprovincialis]
MLLSVPEKRKKTINSTHSAFGKPSRSPRTPTPSSLTYSSYSYSDTFENATQSVNYSDTFETESKAEPTTIKTAKFSTILTELEGDFKTTKDLTITRQSESFPTYSDTFETDDFESHPKSDDDSYQSRESKYAETESNYTDTDSKYTSEETQSYGTRTLESVAESTTPRYSSDDFEDETYSYSESYEYSSTFEPDDEMSSLGVVTDLETIQREEELKKKSEEAKENYISTLISNMRNKRFKDTDITELSLIEPIKTEAKIIDEETENYQQRFMKRKMAILKHKRKHGMKPMRELPWPGKRDVHVTEYGLDPQIVEKLKIKNLITKMGNAAKCELHDPKRCRECREYEKELDEEAAKRHFIRIKKSQIQKDITENQLEKHIIRMNPINLIGELAKSLPRPTADPAEITEQMNQGLMLSKYL